LTALRHEMTYSNAYWIFPNGEIHKLGTESHISMVTKHPENFGLNRKQIEACYKKHNEKLWTEKKAREEIIFQLLDNGFIRIRLYPSSHWSINAKDWSEDVKSRLAKWAEQAKEIKAVGRYINVVIATHQRSIRDYTVEDLYLKKHFTLS